MTNSTLRSVVLGKSSAERDSNDGGTSAEGSKLKQRC